MTRWRARLVAVMLVAAVGGCAWSPRWRPDPDVAALERADDLARGGAWEEAVRAYGAYLAQYPDSDMAPRAAASRDTLRALLTARAELVVQRVELARQRDELLRLREELLRREHDLVRTRQEADRLRTALERLKQIDLKLERRK
jgi:hypothetical protein